MTGRERRRAVARIREQIHKGHGCTHLEALLLLDLIETTQEELISVYRSEEWALSALDRRFHAGDRTETRRGMPGAPQGRGAAAAGLDGPASHQGGLRRPEVVHGCASGAEGGQA